MTKHKWVDDENGKQCQKCGSRINNKNGFVKYTEVDKWGVSVGVNWYPRCLFLQAGQKLEQNQKETANNDKE